MSGVYIDVRNYLDGNNVEALYRDVGNVGHGVGPRLR
jgi:hypothetical protein